MNYPLISEYIEAIRSAEDNFDKLSNLRPVLDGNGNPSHYVKILAKEKQIQNLIIRFRVVITTKIS